MLIHTEATPPLPLEVTLRYWLMRNTCRDNEVIDAVRGSEGKKRARFEVSYLGVTGLSLRYLLGAGSGWEWHNRTEA
jgi:hypothetical protein